MALPVKMKTTINKKVWDRHTIPVVTLRLFERLYGVELLARPVGQSFIIGYNSTVMPNGDAVKSGDMITQEQADAMCQAANAQHVLTIVNDINWPLNHMQAAVLIVTVALEGDALFTSSPMPSMANAGRLDLVGLQLLTIGGATLEVLQRQEYLRRLFIGMMTDSKESYASILSLTLPALEKLVQQAEASAKTWKE
jgi:hypothetical protein